MTEQLTFPSLDDVVQPLSEYEQRFVRDEYEPGLAYYLSRLDRLMLSGSRVLDAGCGVGQWSIALSQRFEEVEAIDRNPERLEVLRQIKERTTAANIRVREGTLESLPYADHSFDVVFCYGVIMFCDVPRVLAEFHRVTRPGGRIYVCLNGDGWSRYLIEERGRTDGKARQAGLKTLYSTYWHRAIEQGLLPSLKEKQDLVRALVTRPISAVLLQALRAAYALGWKQPGRKVAGFLLTHSRGGTELRDAVHTSGGHEFSQRLLDDVWGLVSGIRVQPPADMTRAYLPDEFGRLAEAAGFADFQWDVEAGLVCDWVQSTPAPKYPGTFDRLAAVWEALFVKPERDLIPSVSHHVQEARHARETRLYLAVSRSAVLSNGSRNTYPQPLLEQARALAAELGGEGYLAALARLLTERAANEDQAARRIVRFVQDALFRDPVSQPLTEAGTLPDPLTILLCARGRCGHAAALVMSLLGHVGIEARLLTLPAHIAVEAKVDGRWVIVDADAFKNGVIPVNRQGQMLSLEEIRHNPYQLDRFAPTGWFVQPNSVFTRDAWGRKVAGYVEALSPEQRGYVSGYYVPEAKGFPPSLPVVLRFESKGGHFHLEWTPSSCRTDRLLGYRVAIGSSPRGWTYDNPGPADEIVQPIRADILSTETFKTTIDGEAPRDVSQLYASVTAYSSRIGREPETFFWPSEEARTCPMD